MDGQCNANPRVCAMLTLELLDPSSLFGYHNGKEGKAVSFCAFDDCENLDSIMEYVGEKIPKLDIEDEESHIVDTTKVGEEEDDDDLEALLAQAEEELLSAVLVEVDEESSFE